MNICLVRHGETDWNRAGRLQGREDIPLNHTGLRQAAEAARYLAKEPWAVVIASSLLRAKQTAQIIADALGSSAVTTNVRFIERDYGEASGLNEEQRARRFPNGRYEGMEPWDALYKRVWDGLRLVTEQYRDQNVIIVSHGGVINALLAALSNHVIGSGKNRLQNGCVNMLRYENGEYRIVFYNQSPQDLLDGQPETV